MNVSDVYEMNHIYELRKRNKMKTDPRRCERKVTGSNPVEVLLLISFAVKRFQISSTNLAQGPQDGIRSLTIVANRKGPSLVP